MTPLLVLVPLVAPPALAAGLAEDGVWIGPMAFVEGRTLRDDYFATLADAAKWPTVLARADVLKSYLMVLPRDPIPGKAGPELSDAQLARLVQFTREHGLKVAFEVGGLRLADDTPPTEAGELTARHEVAHLRRWLDAGGVIDYLTTDHAVMMTVGAPYVAPEQFKNRGMTPAEAIEEQADYFAIVHREIPSAKLGAIESLGFLQVAGLNGKEYARTVPALPVWPFAEYFDRLLDRMNRRGLQLDHFHLDFGYEGVLHDGGGGGRLDFGRILAVEAYVQSKGVKAGVIVNAFHDQSVPHPARDAANQEACDRTRRFFTGYEAAGGQAAQIVIQTWQPYPDRTGPEDEPYTVLHLARDLLQDPAFPARSRRK